LEFSGAIAAVLVLLLLQTICDNNRDLREAGPTEKTLFSVPPESEAQDPPNTRHRPHSPTESSLTAADLPLGERSENTLSGT